MHMNGHAPVYTVLTADTPNGVKIPMALEELGLDYEIRLVDLDGGEQKTAEFLALNPNGRIPVLLDGSARGQAPLAIAESGAILLTLAQRHPGLLPSDPVEHTRCLEYLFLQVSGVGPAFGNAAWFARNAPQQTAAFQRFHGEALRLTAVLDQRLAGRTWLAGSTFSIADIAHFGWLRAATYSRIDMQRFPAVRRWLREIGGRPAIQRALQSMRVAARPVPGAVCAI
jgi:GST-like protein